MAFIASADHLLLLRIGIGHSVPAMVENKFGEVVGRWRDAARRPQARSCPSKKNLVEQDCLSASGHPSSGRFECSR